MVAKEIYGNVFSKGKDGKAILAELKAQFTGLGYTKGDTGLDLAHKAGQGSVIQFLETKIKPEKKV